MKDKQGSDDLFDRLNTQKMNEYLSSLMAGLTAKVFRTYNASWTLQQQLKELTDPKSDIPNLVLTYNRANRAVAILCNHQVCSTNTSFIRITRATLARVTLTRVIVAYCNTTGFVTRNYFLFFKYREQYPRILTSRWTT